MEDFVAKIKAFSETAEKAFKEGNSQPMDTAEVCSKEWTECVESFHKLFNTEQSDALCTYFYVALGN